MKGISLLVLSVAFSFSNAAYSFDLGDLANAAKKVAEKKKQMDDKEADAVKLEKAPTWNKLFFYTLQKNPKWKMDQVVRQYWMAKPDSNYDQVKDNEFEFEKEMQKNIDDLTSKVKEFKLQDFQMDISASLGKYNFKDKSISVEEAVGEDNMLLTTAREGQFLTQKPTMSITPKPVPQEEGWLVVPTGYVFQVTNPQVFKSIKISEDLAKKIAAVQGVRGARADVTFEVVGVDVTNKKWSRGGTVGIIKIKIKDIKATWTNGPDGDVLISAN